VRKSLPSVTLSLVAGFGLMLLLATVRHGGIEGLGLRVRTEIAVHTDQEALGPTPVRTLSGDVKGESVHAAATTTNTPSPTVAQVPSATLFPTEPSSPPAASAEAAVEQPSTTPTASKTATAKPTASPTATSRPAYRPAALAVELAGFIHEWQTWNNCGPATLAMNLSYFGSSLDQADIGSVIRPNKEDKHVGPDELAAFARSQGFQAIVGVNGTTERLRLLLSNGVPVMIATWHVDEKGEEMGHYRLVTGYDDAKHEWILYDSVESRGISADKPYPGIRLSYDQLAGWWYVFNGTHIIVYDDSLAPAVLSILGDEVDDKVMWQRALIRARQQVEQRPDDAFAWFTLGTNLLANGEPEQAASAYDKARIMGLPFRILWYQFGPLQAYYQTGRYNELISLADATLKVTKDVEELHYWRGLGLLAVGDAAGARKALRRALSQRPDYPEAVAALAQLEK